MEKRVSAFVNGASTADLQVLLTKDEVEGSDTVPEPSKTVEDEWSGPLLQIFAAVLYGSVGLAMGFINKAVLMTWPYSNTFLTCQMAATLIFMGALALARVVAVRPLTITAATSLWGVVLFYNANVAFALAAVRVLSIPVYHVLKRLTPVFILVTKQFMGEPPPRSDITASVLVVVAGCIISGAGDLNFDVSGYMWAITSCVLQSTYLIMVERTGSERGFSSNELLVYNAVLSMPFLAALILLTGEAVPALSELHYRLQDSLGFTVTFTISLILGVLLNYALFLCTMVNSALTTTIVSALRSVFGTILGFFLLGGVKATSLIICGCVVNTAGGIWYSVARYVAKAKRRAEGDGTPLKPKLSDATGSPLLPLTANKARQENGSRSS